MPISRHEYWHAKFEATLRRDQATEKDLRLAGWEVLVVWECETRKVEEITRKLSLFLGANVARRGAKSNGWNTPVQDHQTIPPESLQI